VLALRTLSTVCGSMFGPFTPLLFCLSEGRAYCAHKPVVSMLVAVSSYDSTTCGLPTLKVPAVCAPSPHPPQPPFPSLSRPTLSQ